ncbi:MAG: DUF1273 family protein [Ruminiclostridium sp.]|nr:DUF1273 family protein [Ruminiclostridium sp.]
MEPKTSCAFTGHRPGRLPWGADESDPRCMALKERLAQAVEEAYAAGCRHFLCGMAQGADLYFGEAVLSLRDRRPDVTLEAAIPYAGQADRWAQADRNRRQDILDRCDYETVVQHSYSPGCMARRNRYMVDRANRLIAVYDGNPQGGTFQTLHYAMQKCLTIAIVDTD